jgi:hypothetical protein
VIELLSLLPLLVADPTAVTASQVLSRLVGEVTSIAETLTTADSGPDLTPAQPVMKENESRDADDNSTGKVAAKSQIIPDIDSDLSVLQRLDSMQDSLISEADLYPLGSELQATADRERSLNRHQSLAVLRRTVHLKAAVRTALQILHRAIELLEGPAFASEQH